MDKDLGTLTMDGDDAVVTFTRRLHHPPEKVWRAITQPEHLAAWFPDGVEGEMKEGATLRFAPHEEHAFDGEVLVFEPPAVLELAWGTDRIRLEVRPDGDGCVLTLTDRLTELGKAARDAAGWHECLARLVAHLDGGPLPDWGTVFPDVHTSYQERFGPEASTIGIPEGHPYA